jgi:hypothetical protein
VKIHCTGALGMSNRMLKAVVQITDSAKFVHVPPCCDKECFHPNIIGAVMMREIDSATF